MGDSLSDLDNLLISAGQTSLLQVQWDFYIGTCLYVAYFCKTGNT